MNKSNPGIDMLMSMAQIEEGLRRADYRGVAAAGERFFALVEAAEEELDPVAVRSMAFNCAMALNHLRDYRKALQYAETGLALSPTQMGKAIGLAAKAEALYGLGRKEEALAVFKASAEARPPIGNLNSADSMARLGDPQLLALAETWVKQVVAAHKLPNHLLGEVELVLGRIALARNQTWVARDHFKAVLPLSGPGSMEYAEAKLLLESLTGK